MFLNIFKTIKLIKKSAHSNLSTYAFRVHANHSLRSSLWLKCSKNMSNCSVTTL